MKIKALIFLLMTGAAQAEVVVLDELPESMITPCVREIPISPLTRAIIPMIPWRGVNLTFPFELSQESTHYNLSGGDVWDFDKSFKGSNIVPISFKQFDNTKNWGTVQDFTISTKGYVFSLALHAVNDPAGHCTNVIFTLSEEEKKRIEQDNKQNYQEILQRDHQERLAKLDDTAEEKALLMVASLAKRDPEKERINEEAEVTFPNGDDAIAYVKGVKVYGNFSTLSFDIENNSEEFPLYIESIDVRQEGSIRVIQGAVEFPAKIVADSVAELVFVTRDRLLETNMVLSVMTNQGKIEVVW